MPALRREQTTSERLRGQADALQGRAFELRREADSLLAEALELRNDADRIERGPAIIPALRVAGQDRDAALMRKVCDTLRRGPKSRADVADHLGLSPLRARTILDKLVTAGAVERYGATRSTRYGLAPEPEPATERTDLAAAIAEAENATLRVFTKTLSERELEDRELAWTTEAPGAVDALPASGVAREP